MSRLHVHLAVPELPAAVRFYSALFGAEPSVLKDDYAKWQLEGPQVNFAISARGDTPGLHHLGIEAEEGAEMEALRARMLDTGGPQFDQDRTTCCYHQSEKRWVRDPAGVAWEGFLTSGQVDEFGDSLGPDAPVTACCSPKAKASKAKASKAGACC